MSDCTCDRLQPGDCHGAKGVTVAPILAKPADDFWVKCQQSYYKQIHLFSESIHCYHMTQELPWQANFIFTGWRTQLSFNWCRSFGLCFSTSQWVCESKWALQTKITHDTKPEQQNSTLYADNIKYSPLSESSGRMEEGYVVVSREAGDVQSVARVPSNGLPLPSNPPSLWLWSWYITKPLYSCKMYAYMDSSPQSLL